MDAPLKKNPIKFVFNISHHNHHPGLMDLDLHSVSNESLELLRYWATRTSSVFDSHKSNHI